MTEVAVQAKRNPSGLQISVIRPLCLQWKYFPDKDFLGQVGSTDYAPKKIQAKSFIIVEPPDPGIYNALRIYPEFNIHYLLNSNAGSVFESNVKVVKM